MVIGGLQKFSLLDYPDHISAIVFTKGCNFRCQYCYNPMLVWPGKEQKASEVKYGSSDAELGKDRPANSELLGTTEGDLFRFLNSRIGKLEAVVVTGGEPTIHNDLPEFIRKIKNMGFKIKLDTNGSNPDIIKKLLKDNLLDYIAMDIKASRGKYENTIGVKIDFKKIEKSARMIIESKIPYEFRLTLVPGLFDSKDIKEICKIISGAKKLFLQKFESDIELLNDKLKNKRAFSPTEMKNICKIASKYIEKCVIR